MNKKIIGISIAMLFAANGAMADSTSGTFVELYGVLDASVAHVNHSLSADPDYLVTVNPISATNVTNSVTALVNGAVQPSRWGIRGSEDLGNGWKAIFELSSYINVNSGRLSNAAQSLANNSNATSPQNTTSVPSSVNGQLFNNTAWVGLKDEVWGKMTFGRQWTGMADIVAAYDAVQDAQAFSPLGFSGASGGGGITENKRQDNSLKYSNRFADFNFGGMYKIGGVSASSRSNSGWNVWGGYEASGFGVQAAYQRYTDAQRETNNPVFAGTVNVKNFNTDAWLLAAKYAWGDFKFVAGYEQYRLKQPSNALASISNGTSNGFPIGNILPATGICGAGNTADFCGSAQKTRILWLGGDYNFSPELNLALGIWDISPRQSGDSQQLSGNAYFYSGLLDYHFTKRTDVYTGIMYSRFNGNQFATSNSSNYIYALGLRTKF